MYQASRPLALMHQVNPLLATIYRVIPPFLLMNWVDPPLLILCFTEYFSPHLLRGTCPPSFFVCGACPLLFLLSQFLQQRPIARYLQDALSELFGPRSLQNWWAVFGYTCQELGLAGQIGTVLFYTDLLSPEKTKQNKTEKRMLTLLEVYRRGEGYGPVVKITIYEPPQHYHVFCNAD